jgi:hypothetical protein
LTDTGGPVQLTVSAPRYRVATANVNLVPSGFIINTPGDFSTSALAANTSLTITSGPLIPATLAWNGFQNVRGGFSVNVSVTATDLMGTNVGAIVGSPLVFGANEGSKNAAFDPQSAGQSRVEVVAPAGFSAPSTFRQLTATVNAPALSLSFGSTPLFLGKDLQVDNIAVSIVGAVAPAGGVVVTLTSADATNLKVSSDPAMVGSGSIMVTIAANTSTSPAFTLQGFNDTGDIQLTGSATNFVSALGTVKLEPSGFIINSPGSISVSTTAANQGLVITSGPLQRGTLNWSGYQPLRVGLAPVSVQVTATDITGSNVGAIVNSPAVFNPRQQSNTTVQFDPQSAGQSQITVVTPAGFSTPSQFQQIVATVTGPSLQINLPAVVGKDLQVENATVQIINGVAPAGGLVVTLTSGDPTNLRVSSDPDVLGLGSGIAMVTIPANSTLSPNFTLQALAGTGDPQVSATATNIPGAAGTVALVPSGFIINTPGDFTTTTFSVDSPLNITSGPLARGSLNWGGYQNLRAGIAPVSVQMTATDLVNTNVGVVLNTPAVFNPRQQSNTALRFHPQNVGQTRLAVVNPAGFSTSSQFQQIVATVRQPNIFLTLPASIGVDLQVTPQVLLEVPPPSPVDVTVTSNSTAIATISKDPLLAGISASEVFTGVAASVAGSITVQGRSLGSTTLTVQAPGYTTINPAVNIGKSGFAIDNSSFITSVSANNTLLIIRSAVLNNTTLNLSAYQPVRGGLTVNVPVSVMSTPAGVGAIVGSPAMFTANQSTASNAAFDPQAVGTATISISNPGGNFFTPSNFQSITATVN